MFSLPFASLRQREKLQSVFLIYNFCVKIDNKHVKGNESMSWSWKTKPRSIIKTIRWFPYFAALEGENWDLVSTDISKCDKTSVHPIRRMYIHSAHRDEDSFLSSVSLNMYLTGQKDEKETEANGRMDKGAYEFFGFGYVKPNGIIAVTEVGNKIVQGTFDSEDYLKQLLKLRLPNHAYQASRMKAGKFVFPMELVLKAFAEYESLNRSELALLFGCDDTSEIPKTLKAIGRFKDEYSLLKNKNDTVAVKEIFLRIYQETYGDTKNKAETFYDYAEALSRPLLYTGLFTSSGRSIATKIRVAQHSETKVKMLREKYSFTCPEHASLDEYMLWFGSVHNAKLPWENPEERKLIIKEKELESIEADYFEEMLAVLAEFDEVGKKVTTSLKKDLAEKHNFMIISKPFFQHTINEVLDSYINQYIQDLSPEQKEQFLVKIREIKSNYYQKFNIYNL